VPRLLPAIAALLLAFPAFSQGGMEDAPALCRSEAERGLTAACERAIVAYPQDAELHALLGQAYFASGFYPEGLQALRQAIRVSKGDPSYRYRFAGFAALVNEYPQAIKELELAVQTTPDDVRLWGLLATCYRYIKDVPQALLAGRRAAELGDPAEAYAMAGRYTSGDGVPVNPGEELRWLEKAAKGGYIAAMLDLARLYADGRPGIPPDPARYKYWKDKARRSGP